MSTVDEPEVAEGVVEGAAVPPDAPPGAAPAEVQHGISRDDFFGVLAERSTDPSDFEVGDAEQQENRTEQLSPTALDLDDWSIRRGQDVLAESEMIRGTLGFDGDVKKLTYEQRKTFNQLALQTADFHAAAFEPFPELAERPEDARLSGYMKALMETPEFKQLHSETQLDESASEYAAASFAQGWVKLCACEAKSGFSGEMQNMRAACGALDAASEQVKELRNAQDAFGLDRAPVAGVFKKIRNSKHLRKIVSLAGRYRRFAQAQQRKKTIHGKDDVVGVVLDNDLARVLPHELACLDDPDLGLDVMRRMVERQLMCRDYQGVEKQAKGPIVVVVDESGSMHGEPIATAKAIALALAWVARAQRRYVCLVGFAGATEGNFLVIPPGKEKAEELMDWLEHFFSGGTDMDVPCDILPKRWHELGCPPGRTDIICITDAICHIPPKIRNRFLAWKQETKAKMISLIINSEPGDLAGVSDQVHRVRSLSIEETGVGEALSI
jgi:uncharacterized protein with von Willebrand factor type A (vWA) domain